MDTHFSKFLDRLRTGGAVEVMPFFSSLWNTLRVKKLCKEIQYEYRDRIYSPAVTMWLFLTQVIGDDHSCRKSVATNNIRLCAASQAPADPDTGSYCTARQRIPEVLFSKAVREVGYKIAHKAPADWKWKGLNVKLIDGTTVTMPDTIENQAEYPQQTSQAKGCGLPIARLLTVFCLATGALLELVIDKCAGKLTGETSMVRKVLSSFSPGDLAIADRLYGSFWMFAYAHQIGFELIVRPHAKRKIDFRKGHKQGVLDQIVDYVKPKRPDYMSEEEYACIAQVIRVRHVRYKITIPGFRSKCITLATTLLDPLVYSLKELGHTYRCRWQVELNIRSIKTQMQMEHLRCKSPSMVRKEIYTHLLAYNLIREAMVESALLCGLRPEQISFKGAKQTLEEFMYAIRLDSANLEQLYMMTLFSIAQHRVGDRPNRIEPRKIKRPPKQYKRLREPRADARKRMTG